MAFVTLPHKCQIIVMALAFRPLTPCLCLRCDCIRLSVPIFIQLMGSSRKSFNFSYNCLKDELFKNEHGILVPLVHLPTKFSKSTCVASKNLRMLFDFL